jgi:hypothetical protein
LYWTAPTLNVQTEFDFTDDAKLIPGNDYNISCSDSYGDGWNGAVFMIGDLTLIDNSTGSFSNKYFSIFIDDDGTVYESIDELEES